MKKNGAVTVIETFSGGKWVAVKIERCYWNHTVF